MEYDLTLFEKDLRSLELLFQRSRKKQFITYYEYLVEKNNGDESDRDHRV